MEDDKKLKPSYYSVIPAEVRYCKGLGNASPRDLYGEISALCNKLGYCYASNKHFADLYEVDQRTIRRWVSLLEKEGFIYSRVKGKQRRIFLAHKVQFDAAGLEDMQPETPEPATPEEPKKKPAKREAKYTDQDLFLAEMLLSKIIYNFPAFENKKVKIDEWADDIRKLREIDKATGQQIEFMITWIHGGTLRQEGKPPRTYEQHDFWSKNILSAKKLRKQWFENLVPQLQQSVKKQVKKHATVQL